MTILVAKPASVFLHIPKTGGSSVSAWLLRNFSGKPRLGKHADMSRLQEHYGCGMPRVPWTFTIVRNPWDRMVSSYFYFFRKHRDKPDFKQWVLHKDGAYMKKQMWQYFDHGDINYVLRFETLAQDFEVIQNWYKCGDPLGHINSTKHKHYTTYYDDESRDHVYRKQRRDIVRFGYTFES